MCNIWNFNSRERWKAFMNTNAFLQGFVVQLKGKDKRKPVLKNLFFFFSDFQTKGAFSQGSIRQAELEWATARDWPGAAAHTGRQTLSSPPGQTPPGVAGVWKLHDNRDIKGALLSSQPAMNKRKYSVVTPGLTWEDSAWCFYFQSWQEWRKCKMYEK